METAKAATPHQQLIDEILDSRIAKSEREHAAAFEINSLRSQLADAQAKAQALDRLEEMLSTDGMVQVIIYGSFRYARWSQDERSMSYAVSSGPWRQSLASAITEAWERSKP